MSRRLRNSATGTTIIDQIGAPIADDGVRVLRRKSIKTSSEQDSSLLPRKKTRLNIEIDQNQNSVYSTPNEQNSSHISLNGNERGLNSPEHKTSIIRRMEMMYQQEFGNITDRLNIKTPIKCFMNQAHCARSHLFNMEIGCCTSFNLLRPYVKNDQSPLFLLLIQSNIECGGMPDDDTLLMILEVFLNNNVSIADDFDDADITEMAASTFHKILQKFPPCWTPANKIYRKLITKTSENSISTSEHFKNNSTLFKNTLKILNDLIQPQSIGKEISIVLDESRELSFSAWERHTQQKRSFDELSRDNKIERAFIILSLFVELFEYDIVMWMSKHLGNADVELLYGKDKPLIVSALWKPDEIPQIDCYIKEIMQLFINYVSIDFPKDKLEVLARLLRLVYGLFDFTHIKTFRDGRIEFPESKMKESLFCDTMTTKVRDHSSFSLNLWLNVIDIMDTPSLKLKLIETFFTKVDGKLINMKPASIHANLQIVEMDFHDYFDEDSPNNIKLLPNTVAAKRRKTGVHSVPLDFPILQKVRRRAAYDVPPEIHTALMLNALVTYSKLFHTKKALQCFLSASNEISQNDSITVSPRQNKSNEADDQRLKKKEMDKFLKTTAMQRIKMATKGDECAIECQGNPNCTVPIRTDLNRCREDVKYFELIVKGMPNLRKLFADTFAMLD